MDQIDIKIILVMMWVNIILNYWIFRKEISDINAKFYKLEKLLFIHEIEEAKKEIDKTIKMTEEAEKEKEENTLQK